ncbi:amidohydrolase family protein [Micromonospora sp. DH15]|nr:amidohydrolase family protein [Micromonospora sp. DH15]
MFKRPADDEVLLPGLVDSHVHVNEPGRTEWEGFASATAAAAAGGITTLVDMPLNSVPPTVDAAALAAKRAAARGQLAVDVAFWGGAVPGNAERLRALHDAGVVGFKCFLAPSGVDEFPPLDAVALHTAMTTVAGFVLPLLRAAKDEGLPVTAETCPHYLVLRADEVPDGATEFKCCPPIRDDANRAALWAGLRDGTIDCVVSDHSPCTAGLKALDTGDFAAAWGGIASVQLSLPLVWTEARRRGIGLDRVVGWMAAAPAALTRLSGRGAITAGNRADLVVFAPDETFVVDPARLAHRHPVTPYAGRRLRGVVRQTWLAGRPVRPGERRGRLVARTSTEVFG